MDQITPKSNDSSISTTGTPASNQYSDAADNDLKYINLSFTANSDTSAQGKTVLLEYQKLQNVRLERCNKELPNKTLASLLPLNGLDRPKGEQPLISLQEKSLAEMGYKVNRVDNWDEIVQPSKEDLYKLLKHMIDNHIKPSVKIQIGDVTFNCHMMVLQCYSDFFMECNNEIHILLPEEKITPGAFMMVYDWMLSAQPKIQREGILELFNAANFLGIKQLIDQCWVCLDDDVRFREDTAFLLYLEARNYGMANLEQLMLMRICKFFLTLVASKEFLTFNAKEICTLLSSNTIGVNSEIEIFMSVVRWLSHSWADRECHVLVVMKCVRFGLMPPWFLVTLNKNTDCIEIDRIIEHAEVKKMISDGITYTNMQLYYGENRAEFLNLLERFQLLAPMQRQWVYDKECKYHHRLACPNMQNISYRSFLEYLEMIRSMGKDYWRSLEMDKVAEKSVHCFLCTACRKSTEPSVTTSFAKNSCDQGIQCPSGSPHLRIKDSKKNALYKSVNAKYSWGRSPRGQPKYLPVSASQTKSFLRCDDKAEAKTRVDENNDPERGVEINVCEDNEERAQLVGISNGGHNFERKQQQQQRQRQRLQTDAIHRRFKSKQTLPHTHALLKNTNNDGQSKEQLLSQQQHRQQQQQERSSENKPSHHEAPTDSCVLIYKRTDGPMDGISGDCVGTHQQQRQQQPQANVFGGNHDVDSMRHENNNKNVLQPSLEASTSVQLYKILLFGGIDPYCVHSQHLEQKQQQHHQQRQRVHSIESIIINATTYSHRVRAHHMQTHAENAAANKNVNNFGDHVLLYDIDATKWRHLSRIPFGSRHHHAVVVCNGLIYIIGGTRTPVRCTQKPIFKDSVWCFNPRTLKWVLEGYLPESRRAFAAVALANVGFYVIGGEGAHGKALNTVWFYNINCKTWLKRPSLNMERYGLAAAVVNEEIWVAGGVVSDCRSHDENVEATASVSITDTIEIYNIKAEPCEACSKKQTNVCSNKRCCDQNAEGRRQKHGCGNGHVAECGNCMEGQWVKSKLRLRTPRLFGKFCQMPDGQLYVVGGVSSKGQLKRETSLRDIDVFNEEQQKWEQVGRLNFARHGHDVAILNEHCFVVIGGVSTFEQCALNKVEAFCTKTRKSLKDLSDLPWPVSGCAAATLK